MRNDSSYPLCGKSVPGFLVVRTSSEIMIRVLTRETPSGHHPCDHPCQASRSRARPPSLYRSTFTRPGYCSGAEISSSTLGEKKINRDCTRKPPSNLSLTSNLHLPSLLHPQHKLNHEKPLLLNLNLLPTTSGPHNPLQQHKHNGLHSQRRCWRSR